MPKLSVAGFLPMRASMPTEDDNNNKAVLLPQPTNAAAQEWGCKVNCRGVKNCCFGFVLPCIPLYEAGLMLNDKDEKGNKQYIFGGAGLLDYAASGAGTSTDGYSGIGHLITAFMTFTAVNEIQTKKKIKDPIQPLTLGAMSLICTPCTLTMLGYTIDEIKEREKMQNAPAPLPQVEKMNV